MDWLGCTRVRSLLGLPVWRS